MEKVKIVILDEDRDFKSRFIDYMINNCRNINIYTIEDDYLRGMCSDSFNSIFKNQDVILTSEFYLNLHRDVFDRDDHLIICFVISDKYRSNISQNIIYIDKYRKASTILDDITDICSNKNIFIKRNRSNEKFSVIAITGASGGVGKTSLCLTLARLRKQASRLNPVVIDMKSASDHFSYFPEIGENLYNNINMLLLDVEKGRGNPEKYIHRDRYGVAEFIMPYDKRSDITELGRKDMQNFLEVVESWNLFDLVIFEMDHRLDDTSVYLYEKADRIFFIADDGEHSKEAAERLESLIRKYSGNEKIVRVINFKGRAKYKSEIFLEDENDDIDKGVYLLPYDPDSFFRRDGQNDISLMGRYSKSVNLMLKKEVKL